MQNERRPPLRGGAFAPGLTFDSVVANMYAARRSGLRASRAQASRTPKLTSLASGRGRIHREFIIYQHTQAYPEYIVWFREG